MTTFTIPSIPGEFEWHVQPLEWSFETARGLSITAGKQTDWFADPAGSEVKKNAPVAMISPADENFLLSAKVSVRFASMFDAGVLHIHCNEDHWAKLCFEYSPQGVPMVVSVVTRGVSDDCNSVEVEKSEIYLRIARTPKTIAFHYSHDGQIWHFVRYFNLGDCGAVRVGFSTQAPTGNGCTAVFSEISYRAGTLTDNRNGE